MNGNERLGSGTRERERERNERERERNETGQRSYSSIQHRSSVTFSVFGVGAVLTELLYRW